MVMAQRVADAQFGHEAGPRAVGLRGIDDLRVLNGITARIVDALQPSVTVLPAATTTNANTATAELLGAVVDGLGLAGARDLAIQRDTGLWFANRADFVNPSPVPPPAVGTRIGFHRCWFLFAGV